MPTTQDQDEFIDFDQKIDEEHERHARELSTLEEFKRALPLIPENLTRVHTPIGTTFVGHGRYGRKHRHNSLITGINRSMFIDSWKERSLDFLAQIPSDLVLMQDKMSELFRVRFREYTFASGYAPLRMNSAHQMRLEREKNDEPVTNVLETTTTLYIESYKRYRQSDTVYDYQRSLEASKLELFFWCELNGLDWEFNIELPENLFRKQVEDMCKVDHWYRQDLGKIHRHVWAFSSVEELLDAITFGFESDEVSTV